MNKFLKKTLLLFLYALIYVIITTVFNLLNIKKNKVSLADTEILIVGDSHIKKAVNPKFIPKSRNISQLGEPLILTYWKLKEILNANSVRVIVLGFAPHNISYLNDLKFVDKRWAFEMIGRSYSLPDIYLTPANLLIDHNILYHTAFKEISMYPKINHHSFLGEFENRIRSNLSDSISTIKHHFYKSKNNLHSISKVSLEYLDSIKRLCDQKKISLILLNTPVHESYNKNIPKLFLNQFEQIKNKDMKVLDFSSLEFPDTLYEDADHLNLNGANIFSKKLKTYLDKHL
jgi:hypothetical protein